MTKLIKRGKIYHIRYYNEDQILTSVSTHCDNIIEAEAYQSKWEREERPNHSYIQYINDVLDYYFDNHVLNNDTVKDKRRIKIAHDHLKLFFIDIKINKLNDPLINRYKLQRTYRGKRVSSGTLRYEINKLLTARNYCIDNAKLPHIKKKIKLPPASQGDDYVFSIQDIDDMNKRFTKDHIKLFIEIALNTSARKKHILELMWAIHIDLVNRLIYFNKLDNWGTTKKGGIVKMNDRLYNVLLEAQKVSKSPYVINWAGKKVKHLTAMQNYKKETLEPKFMTKTFRHTAATWAAEAGISMSEIATMTGHTETKTTERYIHKSPNYQKKMVKVLEDKLRLGKNKANLFLSIDNKKKETKNKKLKGD